MDFRKIDTAPDNGLAAKAFVVSCPSAHPDVASALKFVDEAVRLAEAP